MPWRPKIVAARREVRARHVRASSSTLMSGFAISATVALMISPQVVRRHVRGHADRDAARAIDQPVREARGQHRGLFLRAVVVVLPVDGLLLEIVEHLRGQAGHAHFGVAHGRRGVAVHRAEVALPVDERVAQREVLRHAHHRVVHGGVAVRMVLADDVADDARGLLVGAVEVVAQLVHGEQHAPMHGLEAVAHVGQRAPHDDRHRVGEIRPVRISSAMSTCTRLPPSGMGGGLEGVSIRCSLPVWAGRIHPARLSKRARARSKDAGN